MDNPLIKRKDTDSGSDTRDIPADKEQEGLYRPVYYQGGRRCFV